MAYVAFADNGSPAELFWDFVEEYVIFRDYTYHEVEEVVDDLYTHPASIWDDYREHRMRAEDYRDPSWFGSWHFRSRINILTPEQHYERTFCNPHYHRFFGSKAPYLMDSLYPQTKPKSNFFSRWWWRAIFDRRSHIIPGDIWGWDLILSISAK